MLRWLPIALVVVLVGATLAGPVAAAPAATGLHDIVVGGSCTESDFAAALSAGGTITFACGGPKTIVLTVPRAMNVPVTIDGGDAITLTGNLSTRFMTVESSSVFTLRHIILDRFNGGGTDGGALVNHGTLVLDHATIQNSQTNTTNSGGAIFSSGPLTITHSTLRDNTGGSAGALFANFSQALVSISDSTFSGNRAVNTITGYGGAIWVGEGSQVSISGGAITSNTAQFGGGIYVTQGATVTVSSAGAPALISGNSATHAGGGLYNSIASLTLANATLQGNSALNADSHVATYGGGLDDFQGAVALSHATFMSNTADYGGGANVFSGTLTLDDSRLISNTATIGDGGGIADDSQSQVALSNSIVSGNLAFHDGGGIEDSQSGLQLSGVTFSGNRAEYGGGVEFVFDRATVAGLIFNGNEALKGGGGFDVGESVVTATDVLLQDNAAAIGGGILSTSAGLVLANATLSGNAAKDGGAGLYNDGAGAVLTNVTLDGNVSGGSGGGVYNDEGASLQLLNSTLSNNQANVDGGGILGNTGVVTLENTTLSHNLALAGGGIYDKAAAVALTNVTLSGNLAQTNGGGLYAESPLPAETITLSNTVLAAGALGQNCAGAAVTSKGYNLSSDGTCAGFTQTGDLNHLDPHLGPLANNGGPTLTHLPAPGSPLIDAIPSGTNGCGTFIANDQRGAPRPINGRCDIGAVEAGWLHPMLWLPLVLR